MNPWIKVYRLNIDYNVSQHEMNPKRLKLKFLIHLTIKGKKINCNCDIYQEKIEKPGAKKDFGKF